jgi:hypothetical protein
MKDLKLLLGSAVGSVVITLATGLVSSTPGGLVGASWYGLPVTWIRKLVLAPQYNPWVTDWEGFVIDLVFWFIVIFVILYLLKFGRDSGAKSSSRSRK